MTTTATINFSFSGTISQDIEILDPTLSVKDIITGLNSGEFFTTITHEGNKSEKYITNMESKKIAVIKLQDIHDSSELFDFSDEY